MYPRVYLSKKHSKIENALYNEAHTKWDSKDTPKICQRFHSWHLVRSKEYGETASHGTNNYLLDQLSVSTATRMRSIDFIIIAYIEANKK